MIVFWFLLQNLIYPFCLSLISLALLISSKDISWIVLAFACWCKYLSNLDPNKVYNDLDKSVLLCYEKSYEFCHRNIVAAWLEKNLGVKVVECEFTDDKIIERKRPDYIDEYLNMVMNEDLSKKI